MPDSPTTAMNVDRMMMGEDDYSRRSSLRSTSLYDYEGTHDTSMYLPRGKSFLESWVTFFLPD